MAQYLITQKGLKKIKRRIGLFKNVMRPKASADIGEARDKGDLSENARYDAAKHKECSK
jgi:transcription elongation factor GreA